MIFLLSSKPWNKNLSNNLENYLKTTVFLISNKVDLIKKLKLINHNGFLFYIGIILLQKKYGINIKLLSSI